MNINLILIIQTILIYRVNSGSTYNPKPTVIINHSTNGYIFTIEADSPPQYSFFQISNILSNDNGTSCSNNWIVTNLNSKTKFVLDISYKEIQECNPTETISERLFKCPSGSLYLSQSTLGIISSTGIKSISCIKLQF